MVNINWAGAVAQWANPLPCGAGAGPHTVPLTSQSQSGDTMKAGWADWPAKTAEAKNGLGSKFRARNQRYRSCVKHGLGTREEVALILAQTFISCVVWAFVLSLSEGQFHPL